MTYEIKKEADAPIWIATYHEPYDAVVDAQGAEKDMHAAIAGINGEIYYIPDLRHIDVEFSDIVAGLAEAFKPGSQSFYNNPNVRILTVGTHALIKMAAEAVKQEQYGGVEIKIFATVEEAVAHAKQLIAKEAA